MNKYKKWATGGVAVSIVGILVGCGNANSTTGGSAPAPTNTSNQAVTNTATNTSTNLPANASTNSVTNTTTGTNATSTDQTTSNTTRPSSTTSASMVHLNLTNAQIKTIETSVNRVNGNSNAMTFGNGRKVYVPNQVPQGQQFLNADSGANVVFGAYVSLDFRGFTVSLGSQQPSQLAIRKSNSVKLSNGATGTWYVSDSTTGGTTYYFMDSMGKTYISLYSSLKTVSQAQIEQMAGSMVFLGAQQ
ncbi:hypothetical protein [Alicyclobacillus sp. ALC3]|uniref:hypothetical protein n=1 Tax=Alicyclobacillus sp. ALC3 TaxID=2796143 RepID=UPI0023797B49|nr:hypothetical protein [Alicyclobacillus sp. ALC3]WDL99229.1 hypothetical protein JC200_11615 [Alicyclobacillus sp. ALC3]